MKKYTATLSFANARRSFRRNGVYELNEDMAADYVRLGWLVPVAAPAKRAAKKKVERATAPAVDTATLDS